MSISMNRRTRLFLGVMTTITFAVFALISYQGRPWLAAAFAGLAFFRLVVLVKQFKAA